MAIATINPATGETLRTFDALSDGDVETRLERAVVAFRRWRITPVADRAAVVLPPAVRLSHERQHPDLRLEG